jgi:hypothetical protein
MSAPVLTGWYCGTCAALLAKGSGGVYPPRLRAGRACPYCGSDLGNLVAMLYYPAGSGQGGTAMSPGSISGPYCPACRIVLMPDGTCASCSLRTAVTAVPDLTGMLPPLPAATEPPPEIPPEISEGVAAQLIQSYNYGMTSRAQFMARIAEEQERITAATLPVEHSEELVHGYKRAHIVILKAAQSPRGRHDEVLFQGVGWNTPYRNEERARCPGGNGGEPGTRDYHATPGRQPVTDCQCGFWVVRERGNMQGDAWTWVLEIELAGEIIVADHGWRGEWQRVLKVTAPDWCMACSAGDARRHVPARYIATLEADGSKIGAVCADHAGARAIPDGRAWLHEKLGGAEVAGTFLSDDLPPVSASHSRPLLAASEVRGFREALTASVAQAVRAAGEASRRPGLIPGRSWQHFIMPGKVKAFSDEGVGLVFNMNVTDTGLVMQLCSVTAGASEATVLWEENLPLLEEPGPPDARWVPVIRALEEMTFRINGVARTFKSTASIWQAGFP